MTSSQTLTTKEFMMVRTIAVSTVIGCKNLCSYCPQDKVVKAYSKRSKVRTMSFETFAKCIDKLPKDTTINFAGFSEPCLNPEYTKMILYANKKGHKIRLLTTTIGMKLADVNLIENVPFLRFLIHLPDNQNKTKILVDDDFIKIIERLIDSKIEVNWKFHQSPNGKEDVHPKLKPLLIEAGIYNSLVRAGLKTRAGNVEIEGKAFVEKIKGKIRGCHLLYTNQLLPNGDVFICCMDWELKYFLGNLLHSDYDSLFQSNTFKEILKGFKDDKSEILCRYCELCEIQESWWEKIKNVRSWSA
ncbi:MAG: hypothetical protein DRJ05_00255 [Bacteroidetes bacterium]|nr:MAG: hypothetical protein DRI89_00085 [Bacteroidota bacterium]RLD62492.1 MAG: hypothetical protein DRJ05_00255 [Bacteroidota bacterium]